MEGLVVPSASSTDDERDGSVEILALNRKPQARRLLPEPAPIIELSRLLSDGISVGAAVLNLNGREASNDGPYAHFVSEIVLH